MVGSHITTLLPHTCEDLSDVDVIITRNLYHLFLDVSAVFDRGLLLESVHFRMIERGFLTFCVRPVPNIKSCQRTV